MRTTITLQDDAFALASAYAKARAIKLGDAVSDLIRRASSAGPAAPADGLVQRDGVWVLKLPADAPPLTADAVADFLDATP